MEFVIPFVIIVGGAAYFVVRRAFQMKHLAHDGVPATGTVIKKFRQTTGSTGGSSTCLRYEYFSGDGKRHERKIHVTQEVWDRHEEGGPIDIVYLEKRPSVSAARYMVNLSREALNLPPL